MKKIPIIAIFFLAFLFSPFVFADQAEISKTILDNGLTVLIQELPASEVVSIYTCIKTGAATEGRSLGKGISHFVEHMLFKGTAKRPVGSIPKEVKGLGGVINASTSLDYTILTLDLPKEFFSQGLDIISDMLMNSSFDATELEKERKVIHGEMRLYNDRPDRILSDLVFHNVYYQHPYRHPTIGYPVLFDTISHDEIYSYYKERYIPNNMILSIAGAVKASEIIPLIEQAFKDFKPGVYLERNLPQEPQQLLERLSEKEYDTPLIRFSFSYQGVSVSDPDLYALDVLSMALGQGSSSRLYREVYQKKHLVDGISAVNFTPQDRGVFEVLGQMREDHLKEVQGYLKVIISDIQKNGLTSAELAKTKRQVLAGFIFGNQTPSGLASRAAIDEAVTFDANFSHHYVEFIKKVTNEDIKRVARHYLQDSRLSVTVLRPKGSFSAVSAQADLSSKEGIKKFVLDNGLTILLHEDHSVLLDHIQLTLNGGNRAESPQLAGIALLTGSLWSKGTEHLSEERIDEAFERRGASLSSGSTHNTMELSMSVLSEDLDFALNMLEDMVKNPSFSSDVLNRQRENMLTSLEHRKDDIVSFSSRVLFETFYLSNSLHQDPLGSKETLSKISRADVLNFYHSLMHSNNMIISVFGNCDSNKVLEILKKKFGSLKKGDFHVQLSPESPPEGTRIKELQMDKEQALLMMAFGAPHLKDEDNFGMAIISNILGGGLGGRLFVKIREELGQAYTANAYYSPQLDAGTFVLYVLTRPEKIDSVKELVFKELENLRTQKISDVELQMTKAYLKGSKVRSLLTNEALAETASSDELYGLGYDFYQQFNSKIDAVTIEEVHRLANRYLDISKAALVITKPKAPESAAHE